MWGLRAGHLYEKTDSSRPILTWPCLYYPCHVTHLNIMMVRSAFVVQQLTCVWFRLPPLSSLSFLATLHVLTLT